jgi:hypothetical protein
LKSAPRAAPVHSGKVVFETTYHAAGGLEAERERGDVEEEEVLELLGLVLAREDGGLHGGTIGHGLIRVDRLARLLGAARKGGRG